MTEQGKVITVKTPAEIQLMFEANQIVAGVLDLLQQSVQPGVTTLKLDRLAEVYCRDHKGEPAFKGYNGFPASACVSVDEEVVHGIPGKRASNPSLPSRRLQTAETRGFSRRANDRRPTG